MIRPLTIVTFLMACGSGLYLYQSKHEVQVLDRTIDKTVHETGALREQSRLLSAEWTMLNDPERLRQFSDTYLNLKSINPAQFTSLADLGAKLPPVQVAAPAPAPEEEVPVAIDLPHPQLPDGTPGLDAAPAVVAGGTLPVPPIPEPPALAPRIPAVASVPHATETRLAVARPVVAEFQSRPVAESRPSDQRPSDQRAVPPRLAATVTIPTPVPTLVHQQAQRPIILAAPRPLPGNSPVYQSAFQPRQPRPNQPQPRQAMASEPAPAPYGGSLLGMARGSMSPVPRPTPVNATYSN